MDRAWMPWRRDGWEDARPAGARPAQPMTALRLAMLLTGAGALGTGPAAAQTASPQVVTEHMMTALQQATDSTAASIIEAHLRVYLLKTATPAVSLLVERGNRELGASQAGEAITDFSSAIDLQPELAELYRLRALARFQANDYSGAVHDLEQAVHTEPRDFVAFDDLSHMAEQHGDAKGAYTAWKKLLELDPKTEGGDARLDELRRKAYGQPT
jgi:tetratricopeptide (TPR) repeat protein